MLVVLSNELVGESSVILLPLNSTSMGHFNVVGEVAGKDGMLIGLVVVEI